MALTRMTVNLVPASVDALAVAREHGDDSRTDIVNRALQLYGWWVLMEARGLTHHVMDKQGRVSQSIEQG